MSYKGNFKRAGNRLFNNYRRQTLRGPAPSLCLGSGAVATPEREATPGFSRTFLKQVSLPHLLICCKQAVFSVYMKLPWLLNQGHTSLTRSPVTLFVITPKATSYKVFPGGCS